MDIKKLQITCPHLIEYMTAAEYFPHYIRLLKTEMNMHVRFGAMKHHHLK
ncbi:hypothetical protein [Fusibacter ferrireducens]|uniref:Uncharacterized protein n=1 Tax=Fusibacter ferrireducens TaxID=2785058 RepID=A0ABR9ZP54_9FIRM|nr:hypothetical protein [Fusibacter ferrireducens]MBF4692237.1 hypothetical protein [Fusibacter ferrireducens]